MSEIKNETLPLCVDLDGTLVLHDTTWQAVRVLLKRNIFNILFLVFWILRGRAYLKHQLGRYVYLSPRALDYRLSLLNFLKTQLGKRPIYLVTATDQQFAKAVADYLGIFNGVEASNGRINLRANAKRKRLVELFGKNKYIYIGNSFDDLHVWQDSAEVWVCSHNTRLLLKIDRLGKPQRSFE